MTTIQSHLRPLTDADKALMVSAIGVHSTAAQELKHAAKNARVLLRHFFPEVKLNVRAVVSSNGDIKKLDIAYSPNDPYAASPDLSRDVSAVADWFAFDFKLQQFQYAYGRASFCSVREVPLSPEESAKLRQKRLEQVLPPEPRRSRQGPRL